MGDPAHILIVDDEPNVRLVLRTALETAGYMLSSAADAQAAPEELGRARADIVLLWPRPSGRSTTAGSPRPRFSSGRGAA